jgi:hypothetical protein
VEHCNICKRRLDQPDDETTRNCGDCLKCMADVAEDPDCQHSMAAIAWRSISDDVKYCVYGATDDAMRLDKYFEEN